MGRLSAAHGCDVVVLALVVAWSTAAVAVALFDGVMPA